MKNNILLELLNQNKSNKNDIITHARIGNRDLKIVGGSYNINYNSEELFNKFTKIYCDTVLKKNKYEYLTELQDKENGGPILVDLDFKLKKEEERFLDESTGQELVESYIEILIKYFNIQDDDEFNVFLFMKDDLNYDNNDYNKDGIHIQINLNMMHKEQMFLRKKAMSMINNEIITPSGWWTKLENDIDDIFDKSISSGSTGWLLYGSRKPGGKPYKLINKYKINIMNASENDFSIEEITVKKKDTESIFKELLIRNQTHKKITIKEEFKNDIKNSIVKKSQNKIIIKKNTLGSNLIIQNFKNIYNEQMCDNMIQIILENDITLNVNKIEEIYNYLMDCIGKEYYEPYSEWIRILWALKNIDTMLYPFFLKWSAQSDKFNWDDHGNIENIMTMWEKAENKGLTEGTIRYIAKKSNIAKYLDIRNKSTDYLIHKTLDGGGTDYDIACLIKHLMFDSYRCTSIKSNYWYEFKNNRWHVSECGTGLRQKFSDRISPLYLKKQQEVMEKIRDDENMSKETQDRLTTEAAIYNKISLRLRDSSKKNNLMVESKQLHYDPLLESKLDENPNLLCFTNGIYDFEQKKFREGIPEDYISKCTNIRYIEINRENQDHLRIMNEINLFMSQLFPNEKRRHYMWEHLASSLLGTNSNQTFNIYTGVGSNGKSVLVKLLSKILGDYKGTVPISLITQKRLGIGGTSSEVAQLKGIRYAVMNEPSKGDVINEGIMKEITGGDPIQARELYKQSITFIPQFKLTCCTNTLFDIRSNDEGTWRRIRVVEFESKFVDNPSNNPKDNEFKKDKTLENKFTSWAPIFASMLIEIVNKTGGAVKDCEEVLAASNMYREEQDNFAKFIKEKIRPFKFDPERPNKKDSKISKTNIINEFKEWWKVFQPGVKPPKAQELVDYLNLKLGPYKNRGWKGFEIIPDEYLDDDDDF